MRAHSQTIGAWMMAALPGAPLLRSLRRDWRGWSRNERVGAVGLLLGTPLAMAFALGV